jgi:hypothetical protein
VWKEGERSSAKSLGNQADELRTVAEGFVSTIRAA